MAMVEHQCRPTGMLMAYDEDPPTFENLVVAARAVKAGDHLSLDYMEAPFQDGSMRRAMLRCGWNFVCRCAVCEDPTTFNQHLGSVYCPKCTSEYSARGPESLLRYLWFTLCRSRHR